MIAARHGRGEWSAWGHACSTTVLARSPAFWPHLLLHENDEHFRTLFRPPKPLWQERPNTLSHSRQMPMAVVPAQCEIPATDFKSVIMLLASCTSSCVIYTNPTLGLNPSVLTNSSPSRIVLLMSRQFSPVALTLTKREDVVTFPYPTV